MIAGDVLVHSPRVDRHAGDRQLGLLQHLLELPPPSLRETGGTISLFEDSRRMEGHCLHRTGPAATHAMNPIFLPRPIPQCVLSLRFLWGNISCDSYQMVSTPKLARTCCSRRTCHSLSWRSITGSSSRNHSCLVSNCSFNALGIAPVADAGFGLGAERDRAVSPVALHRTAAMLDVKAEIMPSIAHDMMLDVGWEEVAKRVLSWVEGL